MSSLESIARARVERIRGHISAAWADIVAAHRDRDWITLGYESWDSMCEGEFSGARIALPLEDRRAIVGDLRAEGMSTRAIGSALGVGQSTVRRDLSTEPNGSVDRITGLDGKSRPATRPAIVDLETGEILNATPVTSEVWEAENPLGLFLAADPDIRAANLIHRLSQWIARNSAPLPDPSELADVAPEFLEDIERVAARVADFADTYRRSLVRGLHVVKES